MTTGDINPHLISDLPVLVLCPHNRCNCRCVMCDIWRIRQVREITASDLAPHLDSIRALHVRWVVFSGGEAQLHSDLASIATLLRREGIRTTLLTAGLLLADTAAQVADTFDDVIVSLDGPPQVHDHIRRVPRAFDRLQLGIAALRQVRPDMPVSARSTVQKGNFRYLRQTAAAARTIGCDSVSFLAADTTSTAFNRDGGWTEPHRAQVAITADDLHLLSAEIEALIVEYKPPSFVVERPEKLRRIADHFRAQLGLLEPRAPRCNAPWTSAVIDATGDVRPCFFHRSLGNIHQSPLVDILNSADAVEFRRTLDIPSNPTCRNCVCSLFWSAERAHQTPALAAAR